MGQNLWWNRTGMIFIDFEKLVVKRFFDVNFLFF